MDPGPISIILLSPVYFTRTVYFTRILLSLSTRYAHTLCFKQTGEIDNLIVSWEQSIWLCCVQVPRCSWQSKAWTRRLINCPELSQTSKHHLQSFGFFPFGSINLGFLLRENLAAIFIIPSSWGSQLAGHFHHHHRAASSTFSSTVAREEEEDFCKGSFACTSFTLF